MQDLPRGTVTFLFTDIEDSTHLWEAHAGLMPGVYERHDAILRESAGAEGGVVYKTIGDAFQVAFPTAPAAVAAAARAQAALTREPWPLPVPLRVRMALHTGAVDPDADGDYRSAVLNRLGRLLAAGHGGQVLVSQATMELGRDHPPVGISLRDLGEQRLKDLYRPERVYQLAGTGLPAEFPALNTLDARRNNLRIQPTPLIGREEDIATLRQMILGDDSRLVSLTGPGGIGKTRLALQVAADVLDAFPDGVFFVDLSALTEVDLVPGAIAGVLGIRERGDRAWEAMLRDRLRDVGMLLVLDNFEQVAEAGPMLVTLLADCPRLRFLVTSRVRLGLRGEHEYPAPPLALPDHRRLPGLDVLTQYEAVRLFVDRAIESRPGFEVTNENAPAVAEICVRLDGLPLAIELAAARVRLLPPDAMLRRLFTRLSLLTGGARDLPLRQQTLRGTIAWSYELLTTDEQALYRRLSVFAGGATLEAIDAVVSGDELSLDVLAGLGRLVDHSLLRQSETTGEPRFWMLETIREFGLERLNERGEADEAHRRHAAFFAGLAEEAFGSYNGPEQAGWFGRMESEHDNLRAALAWHLAHDPVAALEMTADLWWFWFIRGHLREAYQWLVAALDAGDSAAETAARGRSLLGVSVIAYARGNLPGAQRFGEQALAVNRALASDRAIVSSLNHLANLAMERDFDEGRALYEQALGVALRSGNDALVATITLNLGNVAAFQGDFDLSTTRYEEALAIWREKGDIEGQAAALSNLGNTELYRRRNAGRARDLFRRSLAIFTDLHDKRAIADCLAGLAGVAMLDGDPGMAARLYGAADAIREGIGSAVDANMAELEAGMAAEVRRALGEEGYRAAWEMGRALTLVEAVAEARGGVREHGGETNG